MSVTPSCAIIDPSIELDHRVDDRLRVNDDVDFVGADAEQPVRLDHLESLVHQRRRVDGDLAAHPPRRMLQRIVGGDAPQARTRGGRETGRRKRSARGGAPRCARGRAGIDGWRCARCRPAGSRRRGARAASVTMPPAITSTSLLASAIVLPWSIAASTASSAVGPGRGAEHEVDVGMRGDRDQAVAAGAGDGRLAERDRCRRADRRRRRLAIATTRGR